MTIYKVNNLAHKPKYIIRSNKYCILVLENRLDVCSYDSLSGVLENSYHAVYYSGGGASAITRILDGVLGE